MRWIEQYRILDLSDEKGSFCGKILGDLGMDVIKIENPHRSSERSQGPFYHDTADPEASLFWFAYNTSKRGITLNIETADGQEIFRRLVKTAHFVIESFPPGYMDRLGLGYPALSEINPRLIVVSITPFGQDGPYNNYKDSDLIAMAMGGLMFICGDPDRAPVRCSVPQTYAQGGAQAAAAAMIAHYHRERTGEGQHIDVSLQECIMTTTYFTQHLWGTQGVLLKRDGGRMRRNKVRLKINYQCKDGFITFFFFFGQAGWRTKALVDWMDEEGMAGDLREVNWEGFKLTTVEPEQAEHWFETIARFFLTHTKAELYKEATKRHITLVPANSVADIFRDEQLSARNYWQEVPHPELEAVLTYPGHPYGSRFPVGQISRRAPRLGEHNQDIYQSELGLSVDELVILREADVI